MKKFILFTKTVWSEPPRIRHQLARLLTGAGHHVAFFEKPHYPWQRSRTRNRAIDPNLELYGYSELLHHRLRLSRLLHQVNAAWVLRALNETARIRESDANDVIVNFNYEYGFLRKQFPRNRIITVINDDFVSRVSPAMRGVVEDALAATCRQSDEVLAVSRPLLKQLEGYCHPRLFLPWAESRYVSPSPAARRDTLLFWGYVNDRLDVEYVKHLAKELGEHRPEIRLLFVGPMHLRESVARSLAALPNVQFRPPAQLEEIDTDRVIAGLIPYRIGIPSIEATTLPNKALQLLARGLPLLIRGMSEFHRAPFVVRLDDEDCVGAISAVQSRFSEFQPAIEALVSSNSADHRRQQFLSYTESGA